MKRLMLMLAGSATGALLLAGTSRAFDRDALDLVSVAITAHGGPETLGAWSSGIYEYDAEFTFGTSEVQGSMTLSIREGSMLHRDGLIEMRGRPFEFVSAATATSAWQRSGRRIFDVPTDEFVLWLAHRPDILLRAREAAESALTVSGSAEVDGEAVTLVDFEETGAATRIALDDATQLVRFLEYRASVSQGMGNTEEVFYKRVFGDYREIDGVLLPHRIEEYEDGVRDMVLTLRAASLSEVPPRALFDKPAPDAEAKEWGDQLAN